jgi:hypothetical protein
MRQWIHPHVDTVRALRHNAWQACGVVFPLRQAPQSVLANGAGVNYPRRADEAVPKKRKTRGEQQGDRPRRKPGESG